MQGGITRANRDDRLLAPTRWMAIAVIPVLTAAFVILYFFHGNTMRLWSWMICQKMTAIFMGSGYLAGAYFFTKVARSREWHRVASGFLAVTMFSSLLLATTVMHWSMFNHDHVSFWAWLALYVATPALLPLLWLKNHKTDPAASQADDVEIPRSLRSVVGCGGLTQLLFSIAMFGWPSLFIDAWPWAVDVATTRTLSAFIAFPAVTWAWFLFDKRWSSMRVTQQTIAVAMVFIGVGALRFGDAFRSPGWHLAYIALLVAALALNVTLYAVMERRARRNSAPLESAQLVVAGPVALSSPRVASAPLALAGATPGPGARETV